MALHNHLPSAFLGWLHGAYGLMREGKAVVVQLKYRTSREDAAAAALVKHLRAHGYHEEEPDFTAGQVQFKKAPSAMPVNATLV